MLFGDHKTSTKASSVPQKEQNPQEGHKNPQTTTNLSVSLVLLLLLLLLLLYSTMNSNNSNDRGNRRFSIDQSLKKDTDELIRLTLDRKIDTVRDIPAPTPV